MPPWGTVTPRRRKEGVVEAQVKSVVAASPGNELARRALGQSWHRQGDTLEGHGHRAAGKHLAALAFHG